MDLSIFQFAIISPSLRYFQDRFLRKFNLELYRNQLFQKILIFGCYTKFEIRNIKKLLQEQNTIYLLWGGTDCHTLKMFQYLPKHKNLFHLSISTDVHSILTQNNIESIFIENFNLLETKHFQNIQDNQKKKNIYIYNGLHGNKIRENFFGKTVYDKVVSILIEKHNFKKEQFIYSNQLCLRYEKMNEIYQTCFIGLRLCPHDGNANTVQEFEYLKIPIIHNCSTYGLKWINESDIIETILTNYTF